MCNFIAAAANVMQGVIEGVAEKKASGARADILSYNAGVSKAQAQDAEQRGAIEESQYRDMGERFKGTQRAVTGAQQVRADSGSVQHIEKDTQRTIEQDALTIRNNAAREAYGYRAKAIDYMNQSRYERVTGKNKMWVSIHGGLARGASSLF